MDSVICPRDTFWCEFLARGRFNRVWLSQHVDKMRENYRVVVIGPVRLVTNPETAIRHQFRRSLRIEF